MCLLCNLKAFQQPLSTFHSCNLLQHHHINHHTCTLFHRCLNVCMIIHTIIIWNQVFEGNFQSTLTVHHWLQKNLCHYLYHDLTCHILYRHCFIICFADLTYSSTFCLCPICSGKKGVILSDGKAGHSSKFHDVRIHPFL